MKILFISAATNVNLYFYKCITAVLENYDSSTIHFYADSKCPKVSGRFNKFQTAIDLRYSNFRRNPFETIHLNEIETTNFKIISEIKKESNYDWIILENQNFEYQKYENLSTKGLVSIDYNYNKLKNQVLKNSDISLTINFKNTATTHWKSTTISLNPEKGIGNNVSKILFNYSVLLPKFLKNYPNSFSEKYVANDDQRLLDNNKLREVFYYCQLALNIVLRKGTTKKLNWKIALKKDHDYQFINQPKNSFWADPFVVKHKEKIFVFFEELKPNGIGALSCMELTDNYEISTKQIIIDAPYHLSFPNVFIHNGSYYMIPESSANNTLDVYECVNFPFEWRFSKTLIHDKKLIDPVVVFHENTYWLFANAIEDFENDNNERLYLYYTNDLFHGNWQAHVQNPIVINASCARNAGKIYETAGKLYRVA